MLEESQESETPQDGVAHSEHPPKIPAAENQSYAPEDPLLPPSTGPYASSSDPYGSSEPEPVVLPPEAYSQEITGYLSPEAVAEIPPKNAPPPVPPAPPSHR